MILVVAPASDADSDLLKRLANPPLFPQAGVSNRLQNTYLFLGLFYIGENPLFYQQCNTCVTLKTFDWTQHDNSLVSFKFRLCVWGWGVTFLLCVCVCVCVCVCMCVCVCACLWRHLCVCARYQWPSDPLPSKISLSPLHHLYCLWDVLMCESKFYWIICGLQRYMGWCWSIQVFVFSSEAASVANVS